MKQIWKEIGLALILGMVLPGIVLSIAVRMNRGELQIADSQETIGTQPEEENTQIRLQMEDGSVAEMNLEAYITGVVLAEMPASFESEALKAQSVVARTYALRAENGKSKHEEAAVCTDSACCQAYRSPDDYVQNGGSRENYEKVSAAVASTEGLVLLYDGELIEATYFSCSGGSTEDAVAVWGTEVPYLVATDSPGEEAATHYSDTQNFTPEEFCEALSLETQEPPKDWFGPVIYTAGGGIETIEICDSAFSGPELRKLLGLRSTAVTFTVDSDSIIAHTRGYGHRVGMSQYGADAMAVQGKNFREILAHYYRGTSIEKLTD